MTLPIAHAICLPRDVQCIKSDVDLLVERSCVTAAGAICSPTLGRASLARAVIPESVSVRMQLHQSFPWRSGWCCVAPWCDSVPFQVVPGVRGLDQDD